MKFPHHRYHDLPRTPSSLTWLINQRAHAKGLLARRRRQLEKLPAEIAELEARIEALDVVIPMHEVPIDAESIPPREPRKAKKFPHGSLTRCILSYLRDHGVSVPRYTTEIAIDVARQMDFKLDRRSKPELVGLIGRALRQMAKQGRVVRHHDTSEGTDQEGLWTDLAPESRSS